MFHCFNPRSREGSDVSIASLFFNLYVSIHAPVKGATDCICIVQHRTFVSIHAPVKGATCSAIPDVLSPTSFNPRSREGSDAHNL